MRPTWTPTLKQVAARIGSRTRVENGSLAGTFTSETEPNAEQVNEIIEQAVEFLVPRLGPIADTMERQARSLAALRAAYMVELAYFPEQAETGYSPYQALQREFKEEMCNWDETARGMEPGSESKTHSLRVATEYPGYATETY